MQGKRVRTLLFPGFPAEFCDSLLERPALDDKFRVNDLANVTLLLSADSPLNNNGTLAETCPPATDAFTNDVAH